MSAPDPDTARGLAVRLVAAALAVLAGYGAYLLVFEIWPLARELPPDMARVVSVLRYPIAGLALILGASLLCPLIDRGLGLVARARKDQSPEP